jgi:hypothetical protein
MNDLDTERIDDAVLAILMLGASGNKAWKGIDAAALDRLHEKGLVGDPYGKTPTIEISDAGLARGKRLLVELFGRSG